MTDLPGARSRAAERLLTGARRGTEPSADDEARVRAQLHDRVLSAPLLFSTKTAHALTAGSKLSAAKVLLALGVCGSTAVVAGVSLKHSFSAGTPATSRSLTQPAATTRVAPALSAVVPSGVPGAVPTPIAGAPLPTVTPKRSASAVLPVAPLSPQDMQLEIIGLRRAQQLLHSGNAGGAIGALDQLSRQVPAGGLMEERDAARVIALCTLGRMRDSAIDAFFARYPHSVHASRVLRACSRASFE